MSKDINKEDLELFKKALTEGLSKRIDKIIYQSDPLIILSDSPKSNKSGNDEENNTEKELDI